MKKLNLLKSILPGPGLALLAAFLVASSARAEIATGYFEGVFPTRGFQARAFIARTSEKGGSARHVGFLFGENAGHEVFGAAYLIQELANGSQSWVQVFRDSTGGITSEPGLKPSYTGRGYQYSGNETILRLNPTSFGQAIGCFESVELHRSSKWSWVDFPGNAMRLQGALVGGGGDYAPGSFNGSLTFIEGRSSEQAAGDFAIVPLLVPGLGMLKAQVADPEATSGISEDRPGTGLILSLKERSFFGSDYRYYVVRVPLVDELGNGKNHCVAPTAVLEEN